MARTAAADLNNLTNTQKAPTVGLTYLPVTHDASAATHSPIYGKFDFQTGLGTFVPAEGGSFFVPISGATTGVWIGQEADITVQDVTLVRTATADIISAGAVQVYVRDTGVVLSGDTIVRLEADFTGSIPTNGFIAVTLGGPSGDADALPVFHNPNAADQGSAANWSTGGSQIETVGVDGYVFTSFGRAFRIRSGSASDALYFDQSASPTDRLLFEAASGSNATYSTGDLIQSSGIYGGAAFLLYLDPTDGSLYHNVSFVSFLELCLQYPSANVLIDVTYAADTTGMVPFYGTGSMGMSDAIVANFADSQDHYIACSQTRRPHEVTKAA